MVMCNYYGEVATYNEVLVTEGIFIDHKGTSPNIIIGTNDTNINSLPSDLIAKYQLTTPQFIPLPHDQQIKLRTFANKTNISFGCEIEGTIKAQVPKSIGATVNTHTEQIRSLNNELNRVKKLEESTVSTVTTESDFTTVEATSNGYFEDVKLEGKTLVNIMGDSTQVVLGNINGNTGVEIAASAYCRTDFIQVNDSCISVLFSNFSLNYRIHKVVFYDSDKNFIKQIENNATTNTVYRISEKFSYIRVVFGKPITQTEDLDINIIKNTIKPYILEGDHTKNPPSCFEGLKSVGQSATTSEDEVDEIVVSSVKGDGNLFDANQHIPYGWSSGNMITTRTYRSYWIKCKPNTTYFIESDRSGNRFGVCCSNIIKFGGEAFPVTKGAVFGSSDDTDKIVSTLFTTDNTAKYLFVYTTNNGVFPTPKIMISKSDAQINYIEPNRDKKRLLYYNEETQTWEKPILRQWDSIEKHANGKYYYHQRSGEEDYTRGDESVSNYITDMTTTVKPLAEEKVYECTNIDLITYANETNFIVESGVLSPKTTLKVHNNISNVVSLLQKKVSLLESNITSYMITQNRLMLASRYNADNVTFKVDYPSMMSEREVEIDYDLFKLIQDNIIVGPENYDVDKMLEIMDLYAMIGFITWEMWDYLYEVIDSQINPVIGDLEGAPEI